jgi:1,4-alpha-glucan branching enzyme
MVMVVSNLTPEVRYDYGLTLPAGPKFWREVLNTDSRHYGGSNLGNGNARLRTTASTGKPGTDLLQLTLPPLATLFLLPA